MNPQTLPVLKKILSDSSLNFQQYQIKSMRASLVFLLDWYQQLLVMAEMAGGEPRTEEHRNRLLKNALEECDRECVVLLKRIRLCRMSVKSSTIDV